MEKKTVYVLDTTAFIARWPLYSPIDAKLVTTENVIQEVRDQYSREGLELATILGRIEVINPPDKYLTMIRERARREGLDKTLSLADLSIVAIALYLLDQQNNVTIVTDDYKLQNIAAKLGIEFTPLRTRGIREIITYTKRCTACGYTPSSSSEEICPVCGSPLRAIRVRKTTKK